MLAIIKYNYNNFFRQLSLLVTSIKSLNISWNTYNAQN